MTDLVSPRLRSLAESLTLAVDAKAQELARSGRDIVNFGAGQPDFPTPDFICEAAFRAVREGATRYTPAGGVRELREAAAETFRRRSGIPARLENTVVTCGAKHALYDALAALLHPGDEALIPVPYWVTYPEQVKLVDGVPVPVHPAEGLRVTPADLDRARTERTRVLLLNSPNNPSGTAYTPEETEALAAWCARHRVWIISDEIYDRLVYDGVRVASPASFGGEAGERTITINGVSKTYCMTGWRIGFLTGPVEVARAIARFQGQTTGNPSAPSQAAALAAITGPDRVVEEMVASYRKRRDLLVEALAGTPGLELEVPRGAFYAFPRVSRASRAAGGSLALADRLLEDGVAVVPGIGFGAEDHVRISFVVAEDRLREGLRRFRRGLERLTSRGG